LNKQIVIPCSRMILVLNESDLINGLKSEILEKGLRQGKGYRRAAECEKRQTQVDRWQVYEWLKGNRIPENAASLIETMSIKELREGVIEFLLSRK
jgi:hypothetical protein